MISQCHHDEREREKASLSAASGDCALSLQCIRTRAADLQRSTLRRAPNNLQTLFLLQIRHSMSTFCVRSLRTPRTRLTKGSDTGHSNRFMFVLSKIFQRFKKSWESPKYRKKERWNDQSIVVFVSFMPIWATRVGWACECESMPSTTTHPRSRR